jgi:hypothetical protein
VDEIQLRCLCRSTLERLVLQRAARWKQRGKFRAIKEGDENSRFFHARASQRLRRNSIRVLDVGGVVVATHDAKAAALYSFYNNLLGRRTEIAWDFDIDALYRGCPRIDGDGLVGPFSAHEIAEAVNSLDRSSAPGPDGLGPGFYRAAWSSVGPALLRLFEQFHSRAADLLRINMAHIALIPKLSGALSPASFRPVSLQNCSIKSICKALTSRLQRRIGAIIDVDQTGFLSGRSISENFVYATELVQTCYRRRAPCIVLKLDFAKAFDSSAGPAFGGSCSRAGFLFSGAIGWMTSSLPRAPPSSSMASLASGSAACVGSGRGIPSPPTSSSSRRMCCSA